MSAQNHIANLHLLSGEQKYAQSSRGLVDGSGRSFEITTPMAPPCSFSTFDSNTPQASPLQHNYGSQQLAGISQQSSYINNNNKTFKDLENSVDINELNIYAAGKAVHEGYSRNDATVHEQVSRFVTKYASRVTSSKLPPPQPFLDQHYLYIMTHGYGIVSQLALAASHAQRSKVDAESMELGEITGAVCNLPENIVYRYPYDHPFSGEVIDMRSEMPRKKNSAAHVLIKKTIFTLLGRACTNPTDIQELTWAIPDDASAPRCVNPTIFPRSLYDDIQNLLLQFFRLDDELLCRGTYDEESCKDMKCLKGTVDPIARKNRYMKLHRARATFLSTTYHYQFKAAIIDLKRSTYIPPPPGQKFGIFKLKPHAKLSKRQRIEEEEDEL